MGVPDCPPKTNPRTHTWFERTVDLPAFGVAQYAVTVGEYLEFADATGYPIGEALRTDKRFQHPRKPAAFISWLDAVHYIHWLNRELGACYRMLRDAEYEKAARGGLIGKKHPWGDEPPDGRADIGKMHGEPLPVGSFPPNGYGLHDMVGSIWSWCEEPFESVVGDRNKANHLYDDTLIRDLRMNPICRGGSYKTSDLMQLHCAYRHEDPTDGRFDSIGLRLGVTL